MQETTHLKLKKVCLASLALLGQIMCYQTALANQLPQNSNAAYRQQLAGAVWSASKGGHVRVNVKRPPKPHHHASMAHRIASHLGMLSFMHHLKHEIKSHLKLERVDIEHCSVTLSGWVKVPGYMINFMHRLSKISVVRGLRLEHIESKRNRYQFKLALEVFPCQR